jgi:type 1 glutamine amidotransferase
MAPFKGHKGFRIVTEIYATTPPIYSRDKQLVLMSLDMSDPATRAKATETRDMDTGISWIKNWGKGRMFYTVLGHGGNHAGLELENKPVLEHLLLGIQWALGDLKDVDATPKGAAKKN